LSSCFDISSTSVLLKFFIVELLTFEGDMLPCFFSDYLCSFGIFVSEVKSLVGGFNLCPSVEVFIMLRQDWTVAGLWCSFFATGLEYGSVVKHSPTILKSLGGHPSSTQEED
jgi:hypothetical protein